MNAPRRSRFPFSGVVLVADDPLGNGSGAPMHLRRDLEMADAATTRELLNALSNLGLSAYRYNSPQSLCLNVHRHQEDVVLSTYGGQVSRNRTALVPAICEANGLRYVGPDVYGSIICQDKELSKTLARECGLETPWYRIIRTRAQLSSIDDLPVPFVVKPLLEGSSIGIAQRNLVRDHRDGIDVADELLREIGPPVLVEGFVGGAEVSYNCIETGGSNQWAYSEIAVLDDDSYFDDHLFDADEKLNRRLPRSVRTIDSQLAQKDKASIDYFLSVLGHFGYCRVDGKHQDGRFVFLEITPDAWLARSGAFAMSFLNKGWSYEDIIAAVVLSAIRAPHGRSANG